VIANLKVTKKQAPERRARGQAYGLRERQIFEVLLSASAWAPASIWVAIPAALAEIDSRGLCHLVSPSTSKPLTTCRWT
jgi:hypothetical protein